MPILIGLAIVVVICLCMAVGGYLERQKNKEETYFKNAVVPVVANGDVANDDTKKLLEQSPAKSVAWIDPDEDSSDEGPPGSHHALPPKSRRFRPGIDREETEYNPDWDGPGPPPPAKENQQKPTYLTEVVKREATAGRDIEMQYDPGNPGAVVEVGSLGTAEMLEKWSASSVGKV